MGATPAVSYKELSGRIQIYVDGVLRLDAPWTKSWTTPPETNAQIKKWTEYVIEDGDESSEELGAAMALASEGFDQGADNVWRKT